MSEFDFESIKVKALEQLKAGKSLLGKDGAFAPLLESFQSVGYHPRQVYDFVWGRYLMEAKYEDRPLSKLTKDILDLLDISRG